MTLIASDDLDFAEQQMRSDEFLRARVAEVEAERLLAIARARRVGDGAFRLASAAVDASVAR